MGAVNVYALVALLASLSYTITALPASIPDAIDEPSKEPAATAWSKVLVYNYSATVSAGQNEPSPFASKFELRGKVIYHSDSKSKELSLRDFEYAIYNGHEDGQIHGKFLPLDNEHIYKPVKINYDEHQQIKEFIVSPSEDSWTKNLKKSLALLFHVDRTNNNTLSAYHRLENTGYGTCKVDYSTFKLDDGQTIVEKAYQPRKCSDFVSQQTTDSNAESCDIPAEEDLATVARKIFTFGKLNDTTVEVIKKVSSHEKMDYLPWAHRSYGIQFIETNQNLEFERVAEPAEFSLIPVKGSSESIQFKYFSIPEYSHEYQEGLIAKVKESLVEMIDFFKDNQIDIDTSNPEHKYLLDKLYVYLGSMDETSLHYLWKHFTTSEKGNLTRQIFLRMIPYVATTSVWDFVISVITHESSQWMNDEVILRLLAKLPIYVKNPSIRLVSSMAILTNLESDSYQPSYKVKQAGVLCYSILLNKVIKAEIKDSGSIVLPEGVKKIVDLFYDHIKFENTYANKIVYMMALRNIGYNVYDYLAPIARGDTDFYVDVMIEKREKYQIAAMWAVAKSISKDYSRTYELFWPILANVSLPLSTRITAYELLVSRNPLLDMNILMRVHELMDVEKNEQLFNYHYTTLRSNSESTNPCMQFHAEMMRKVWRLTKPRKIYGIALSAVNVYDYYDPMYGHGKTLKMAADFNENSGIPQTGYVEMTSTNSRRPKPTFGYYWNVDGINFKAILKILSEINFSPHVEIEITNKDIHEILKKTQGYKLFDNHIHVEWWTLDQGYVTNVNVYFESSLVDLIRNFNDKYKLDFDSIMEVESKYNIDALDISFANQYEMTATNDMGLPVYFVNYVPSIWRAKLNPRLIAEKTIAMTVDFDAKFHRHSVVQMKFLNPIINTVHSVERRIVVDAALPIDVTFSIQHPTETLKVELPRLTKESSAMGLKIHSFDRVVVDGSNVEQHLQAHCPNCKNQLDITNGPSHKTNNFEVSHHLDSGLEFTHGMFDCEHDFEPDAEKQEWYRIFNLPRNSWKSDVYEKFLMIIDHGMFNFVNNPYTGTCGMIMKVARCTEHPVSHIEINMRKAMTVSENGSGLIVRGNVDIISAETNVSMRNWEADLGLDYSDYSQTYSMKLTRKVPGEQDLKICASAEKAYPKIMTEVTKMEYKTQSELQLKMGHTEISDDCPTDLIDIKAVIIGERLEEQIEELNHDVNPASCFKNASNSMGFEITRSFDWDCLNEAIKVTTLRKYTVDITYGEMPIEYYGTLQMIQDWVQLVSWPRITYKPQYTGKGHAKIYMSYPSNKNYCNITFVNPYHTIELVDVIYEQDEGIKERSYDVAFDNVIFPTNFLVDYYNGNIRPCIAHPEKLVNDMNQSIPMEFKDWTLMYGDYALMSYAVFVKTLADGRLAVKIYDSDYDLKISHDDTKPIINLNGMIRNFDEEKILQEHTFGNYKLSKLGQFILIDSQKYSKFRILYSPYNVIVMPQFMLDRSIDGVCGHMGTSVYTQQVPLVYSNA